MPQQDTPVARIELSREEYRSMRETIQHRGTLRVTLALVAWCVWAGLSLFSWTMPMPPLAGMVPLLVLVGAFEIVLALHTGVERIGRYVQILFEDGSTSAPAWEHVAMGMGARWLSPGGLDPLFGSIFLVATLLNALPTIAAGATLDIAAVAITHVAFAVRILMARRFASQQRAHDLAALRQVISSNSLVSNIQQER